jgi:uncharacterized protein (UPF0264 family)
LTNSASPSNRLENRVHGAGRPPRRVDWLVSVRSEHELLEAIRFEVDIIDFKEPAEGPLASVDPQLWTRATEILCRGPDTAACLPKLSAALGERDRAAEIAGLVPPEFSFAKAGPSRSATQPDVTNLWSEIKQRLAPSVELVAVAYADSNQANCIDPESILSAAARCGIGRCLLDTFGKDGQSSLRHLGIDRLARFAARADQLGIWWALAGSVTLADVAQLSAAGIVPNCFAIRGDVCDQDRTGSICSKRMQAWQEMLVA